MWISEIKIRNFRPFYGEHKINFKEDSQEKFTIIEAKADTGKTTFLSAICWCLYGKDLGDVHEKNIHPFNLDRKEELEEGSQETIEVEITVNDDGDSFPRYMIKRSALCTRIGDRIVDDGSFVTIWDWQDNEPRKIENQGFCKLLINSILPEDIHMFFLFEGEKLEKHFSFYNQENIKSAIEKISQIQHVKSAYAHLEEARNKIYNSGMEGRGNRDFQRNLEQIEGYENKNKKLDESMLKYEQDKTTAEERIYEIDQILSKVNVPLIEEWVKKRSDIEKENQKLEKDQKTLRNEISTSLLEYAPLAICSGSLDNLLQAIEVTKQSDELPPKIKNIYVKQLLENKICICNRSLDPTDPNDREPINKLSEILEKNKLSDMSEILIESRYKLIDVLKLIPEKVVNERSSKLSKINEIEEKIRYNLATIREINQNLEEYDEESIRKLSGERSILNINLGKQTQQIGRIQGAIKINNAEIAKLRISNESLAKKLNDFEKIKKTADFMDRALTIIKKINMQILDEVRDTVEKKTFESFINLHWDKINYTQFIISKQYTLKLLDSHGNERIYNISSGTKQVLLLSFISALAEVSGFKFPIFIDTPLANTDNTQRSNIAKNLPDYLKGNQIILLVKDQEYTPQFRGIISERVSNEYKLVKQGGRTEVIPWS